MLRAAYQTAAKRAASGKLPTRGLTTGSFGMPSQAAPRHRATPTGAHSHRLVPAAAPSAPATSRPGTAGSAPATRRTQRAIVISAGSVFCALFALALATLPARRSGGEKPLTAGAAGDSAL